MASPVPKPTHEGRGHPHLPLAAREVLAWPVRWIAAFSAPLSLRVALGAGIGPSVWTSSRERHRAAQEAGEAALSPLELIALVEGGEAGRLRREDLRRWLEAKRVDQRFRITRQMALGGTNPVPPRTDVWWAGTGTCPAHVMRVGWTLGRLVGWAPEGTVLEIVSHEPEGDWVIYRAAQAAEEAA